MVITHLPFNTITQQEMTLNMRHYSHCAGWGCLESAEQAGIITSIIFITMVLLFLWMYFLGKVATDQQRLALRRQQNRRERRRIATGVYPIPLARLPIVPRFPSDGIQYVPVFYTVAARGVQGHALMIPYEASILVPTEPITFPHPIHHRNTAQPDPEAFMFDNASIHPSLASSADAQPREATWIQRLCRAFSLPIGTASTVDSQSSRGTPSADDRVQDRQTVRNTQGQHGVRDNVATPLELATLHQSIPDVDSPPSAVATVHSDDYDLISNATTISPDN
ncbi:hypothetical protein ACHAPU_005195 [Fusarium lateritium]